MKFLIALSLISLFTLQSTFADEAESKTAKLKLTLSEEDSVKQVKATITESGTDGIETPVKGVEVKLFVKKSFGLLPIGDAVTTDEKGEASAEFFKDLPGDQNGNLTIIAKTEDDAKVGTLEESKVVTWGVPTVRDENTNKRALWASGANAPWPLVIASTTIVIGVWGVILYIIFLLFKIKKSGKYETV